MQHGLLGFPDAQVMLQALSATPATPIVRVSDLGPAQIMHFLDAGAYGVICPMILSPEQAEALVAACRYPPVVNRSFGPLRGLLFGGPDYVDHANETVMAIPMIETAEGVERIEEILDVPGIGMIYLGPKDMAFAFDGHVRHPHPKSEAALACVLLAAASRCIPAGIFCASGEEGRARLQQGFRLVTPGNNIAHPTRSIKDAVRVTLSSNQADGIDPLGY